MTNLTEQWENCQLESFRWYYVKFKTGEIDICWLTEWSNDELGTGGQYFDGIEEKNILEILAPVPSFEELENMNKAVNECMAANIKLVEENKQLKEQINKCCLDAINRGTANTVKAVKEFGMPERIKELVEENAQLKEYGRIVASYYMKPIDYETACETVNKLLDERKDLKHRNENLQLALKTYELPEIQKVLIDWRTGELDKKFNKLEAENTKLKELLKECREPLEVLAEKRNACDWYPEDLLAKISQVLGEE